ncbi:MAG: DUF2975 domain-containing protein [Oscillospiraceae bacterium]|nr:DUF2975 domain-containing protein [Oscillospiraceae bacterium]
MNWSRDKSIVLSQVCVAFFALCLLALDVGAYWFAAWFVRVRLMSRQLGTLLMVSIYAGSIFGWVCLLELWRLLANIRRGELFVPTNVRSMRVVSWCCVWAAAICALSALYYLPFLFLAAAAGFMALIVRIVKNAFAQAIAMKDELDLTV